MEVERKELFKVRFSKYYPVLCHTAAGYVADADDCEDIVQDRLPEEEFASYVTAAVKNNCISFLRKKQRLDIVSMDERPMVLADRAEELEPEDRYGAMLQDMLLQMPPKCREIFEMSKLRKMKYRDIAATLGISEKTVENQMGKALKIIRACLMSRPILIILTAVSQYIAYSL